MCIQQLNATPSYSDIQVLKRMLWVFQKTIPKLEYCPMLPQVIGMFLTFLSESETYTVIL